MLHSSEILNLSSRQLLVLTSTQIEDASKDGQGVIGLQMGSNKGASQKGMAMGASRHVADIRADQMDQQSAGVINLQYGSNQGQNQSGMKMGGRRNIMD